MIGSGEVDLCQVRVRLMAGSVGSDLDRQRVEVAVL